MEIDLKKLEEKYSKNKPTFSLLELVICSALVMIGCALFYAMPDEMGIWGWILFVVGAFLNVVGIFRLAAMVPEVKSDLGNKIVTSISLVAAGFIQCIITIILIAIAIILNIRDDFSSASVSVGTILLIEAVITGKIVLPSRK